MARIVVQGRAVSLDGAVDGRPALPPANLVDYAVRDQSGRLLLGDGNIPAVSIADRWRDVEQLYGAVVGHRERDPFIRSGGQ